eukprot:scaffold3356_cov154-Skeletonema_menzelii.AAC.19
MMRSLPIFYNNKYIFYCIGGWQPPAAANFLCLYQRRRIENKNSSPHLIRIICHPVNNTTSLLTSNNWPRDTSESGADHGVLNSLIIKSTQRHAGVAGLWREGKRRGEEGVEIKMERWNQYITMFPLRTYSTSKLGSTIT